MSKKYKFILSTSISSFYMMTIFLGIFSMKTSHCHLFQISQMSVASVL